MAAAGAGGETVQSQHVVLPDGSRFETWTDTGDFQRRETHAILVLDGVNLFLTVKQKGTGTRYITVEGNENGQILECYGRNRATEDSQEEPLFTPTSDANFEVAMHDWIAVPGAGSSVAPEADPFLAVRPKHSIGASAALSAAHPLGPPVGPPTPMPVGSLGGPAGTFAGYAPPTPPGVGLLALPSPAPYQLGSPPPKALVLVPKAPATPKPTSRAKAPLPAFTALPPEVKACATLLDSRAGFTPEERIVAAHHCGLADRGTLDSLNDDPSVRVYQVPGLKMPGASKSIYSILVDAELTVLPRFTLSPAKLHALTRNAPGRTAAEGTIFRGFTSTSELRAYAFGFAPGAGLELFVEI